MGARRPMQAGEILQTITRACEYASSLRASLPERGDYGSGTARVLAPAFAGWSEVLDRAGAPGLPSGRPDTREEGAEWILPADAQQVLGQSTATITTRPDVAELATRQGERIAEWIVAGGASARDRLVWVRDRFGALVTAVERRAASLGRSLQRQASEGGETLHRYLSRWVRGGRRALAAFGRFAGSSAWLIALLLVAIAFAYGAGRGR